MPDSRIVVLGSSSGMPSPTRFCSSLFFQTEKTNFLIDCGEGVSFSLLKNKIDPLLIDSIFVSHSHIDHLGGLFLLVQMMYLLKRKAPLEVYIPEEAIFGVKNYLCTCYLSPEKLNFKLSFLPIAPNFRFEDHLILIEAHLNHHLSGNQAFIEESGLTNKMQSHCFTLSISGKKIVYSGDIGSAKDLAGIIQDADILITECVHPSLHELLSLIVEKCVKSSILTHIPLELEARQKEIVENAGKMGLHRFSFAYDGLSIMI
jgi:ribonuclease BN (tRNA processing enzyme)